MEKLLKDKSSILIFTYAPAGFGHLRVMDALYRGLPADAPHTILGVEDKTLTYFHRFTSIHPFARFIFEWTQSGIPEDIFTNIYRKYLRSDSQTRTLYEEILAVLNRSKTAKKVIIVATHYAVAHKLAAIKEKIQKERGINLVLILQVTDDTPQKIWYVPDADIIFVPSKKTKEEFLKYIQKARLKEADLEVSSYPLGKDLGLQLSEESYQDRVSQLDPKTKKETHILIPISGAAVGMEYSLFLMDALYKKSSRFRFHVIVLKNIYTQFFLSQLQNRKYVEDHAFNTDREIVDEYEAEYRNKIISLEVTKPSEQAFKSLLNPTQVGGSILLFSKPIGRQEYDNLNFLQRHGMIPSADIQYLLHKHSLEKNKIDKSIIMQAKNWRGLRLPNSPSTAADFIFWCLEQGVFYEMMKNRGEKTEEDKHKDELGPNGVEKFWEKVEKYLEKI